MIPETYATGADGAAKFVFAEPVHPRLSVTITPKFPEPKFEAVAPVPPEGDQEYVYGPVPPLGIADAEPLFEPQVGCIAFIVAVTAVA